MKKKNHVSICIGSACFAKGNAKNIEIIERFLKEHNLTDEIDVDLTGAWCSGSCPDGPLITVNGRRYTRVDAECMQAILRELFPGTGTN